MCAPRGYEASSTRFGSLIDVTFLASDDRGHALEGPRLGSETTRYAIRDWWPMCSASNSDPTSPLFVEQDAADVPTLEHVGVALIDVLKLVRLGHHRIQVQLALIVEP